MNDYRGEFATDVDQADKHLTVAQELINEALPTLCSCAVRTEGAQ